MDTLLSDIFAHLFSLNKLRLSDIINLTMVSRRYHRIALLDEAWYIITDTYRTLKKFIDNIFLMSNRLYPIDKIHSMCTIDDVFEFDCPHHGSMLPIFFPTEVAAFKFYEIFPNYQSYSYRRTDSFHLDKIFKEIIISHHITEFFTCDYLVDCELLIKFCPYIEKLSVNKIYNIEFLNLTKLKYLHIQDDCETDVIIQNLPNTIESLLIQNGYHTTSSSFDQLNKFPCLSYLKINLERIPLSTILGVHTLFLTVWCLSNDDIIINVPNIKNIIITHRYHNFRARKLSISSISAVTCKIMNIHTNNNTTLDLPSCPKIIALDPKLINLYHIWQPKSYIFS